MSRAEHHGCLVSRTGSVLLVGLETMAGTVEVDSGVLEFVGMPVGMG